MALMRGSPFSEPCTASLTIQIYFLMNCYYYNQSDAQISCVFY